MYSNDLLKQVRCQNIWLECTDECRVSSYSFVMKEKVRGEGRWKPVLNTKNRNQSNFFFIIKLFSLPPPSVQSHKFVNKNTIIISMLFFYGCILNFQRNHFRLQLFIAMMYISLRDKGHLQRPSSWSLENKRNPNQSQENKEKSWQQSHRTILHKTLGKWRTQVSALNLMESDTFSLNIIKV